MIEKILNWIESKRQANIAHEYVLGFAANTSYFQGYLTALKEIEKEIRSNYGIEEKTE